MSKLIPVGLYRELCDDPDEQRMLPSIAEAIFETAQENEEKVVAFLRSGICLGGRGSYEPDVLDPSCRLPLTADTYTDGTYVWRLDIAHYVEKYHLRLSANFISHMTLLKWQTPTKKEVNIDLLEI